MQDASDCTQKCVSGSEWSSKTQDHAAEDHSYGVGPKEPSWGDESKGKEHVFPCSVCRLAARADLGQGAGPGPPSGPKGVTHDGNRQRLAPTASKGLFEVARMGSCPTPG